MCPVLPALFPAILSPAPSMPASAADAFLFLTCFCFFTSEPVGASCGLTSQATLLENLLFLSLKAQLTPLTALILQAVSSRLTPRAGQRQLPGAVQSSWIPPESSIFVPLSTPYGTIHSACLGLLQDISLICTAVSDTQWVSIKPPSTQPA